MNAILINDKAQVFDLDLEEVVFLWISVQLGLAQAFDNELQILLIFFLGAGENKNIIKVDYIEDVNVITERTVDIGLKGGRGISQTKRHHKVFIVPITGTKRYFPLVTFPYPYLIIGVSEVDFREDDKTVKPIKKLIDKREQVTILNRKGIQASVVNVKA